MTEEPFPEFDSQDHVGSVGTTRAGKTTLFKKKIVPEQTRVLVIDTKGEDWNHLPAVKWKKAVERISRSDWMKRDHTTNRFRWRIPMGVGEEAEADANAFAVEALKKLRNVTIYWDEIGTYCNAGSIGDGLKSLITQGGGRDLRFYWGTQMPQFVHASIYANTSHFFVFHIRTKDRRAVKKYFPYFEEMADQVPYRSYKFIYEDPSGEPTVMGPV